MFFCYVFIFAIIYIYIYIYIYSHLNFILDIRLIRYIDLMDSVIKRVITVGLGKIPTNNKGKELNSLIIYDKTYRCNKDKPLTQTLKTHYLTLRNLINTEHQKYLGKHLTKIK